uniref:Uncharacterized protein n=1 Tax=Timema poppense TaxID=170557 RepID=A0A7R9H2R5_TIMPO|nr:unnamed protein product [Timema poppensis]
MSEANGVDAGSYGEDLEGPYPEENKRAYFDEHVTELDRNKRTTVILLTKEQRENEIIRYKNYCFYNYSSTCVYKLTRQVREVLLRPLYGDVAFSSPSQHKKGYLVGFHSHPDYRRYLLQACNRNHNYSPRNHQAPLKGSLTTQKRESDNAVSYWNPNSYLRDDIQCNIIIAQGRFSSSSPAPLLRLPCVQCAAGLRVEQTAPCFSRSATDTSANDRAAA